MTLLPDVLELAHFRALIAERLGLHFDESKQDYLAKILHRRAQATGEECAQYLSHLASPPHGSTEELYRIAGDLTVCETYFLRNKDQFNAYLELALPDRLAADGGGGPVRVLSAGCASGDEPYSLAIVASEHFPHALHRFAITALDVNPAMLEKAARGRYTQWSLRDFPAELKARWFSTDGDNFILNDSIRKMVTFEQRNLAQAAPDFWKPASVDIVFCRNVLMYFTPEQAQAVIARIARALVPGGYLFLGHAETLRGLSNDFHLCHTHGTFYYQRKESTADPEPWTLPAVFPLPTRWQPSAVLGDTAWIAEIQRSSDRIQALSAPLADTFLAPVLSADKWPAPNLHRALEYLHHERYDQTLEQLKVLPVTQAMDPDVLLLKAVSLSHSGALDAAQAACRALLECDELNAGAYYVLALCCEGAGDLALAIENDQTATYLDPSFAMPRLHLGLLARRRGEPLSAQRELAQALLLLQKEDASRLLLFGGGFKREALIALCRAELTNLEKSV
ncbi:MAG: protein-glutamate O-methyltransferase CheR [Rhodoferax sp.]|nr:protein-glutamate O-methyltransferase CheR [Rhodoferax sp.]MDP3650310.1 protein-glutamate O-methyltransferase CheR [Rhodoferax sp.]